MPAKLDKKEFIKKLKYFYRSRFDYSLVEYVNMKTGVLIRCKIHGKVLMSPGTLIYKKIGCKECRKEEVSLSRKDTQEEFIDKCKNNHGEIYEYTKTKYIDSKTPVLIIIIQVRNIISILVLGTFNNTVIIEEHAQKKLKSHLSQ